MPEQDFSNREITSMFHEVKDIVTRVETQTTRTNGRVDGLEKWQDRVIGGMAVLTLVVVPMLGWALYTIVTIKDIVHESVDEALSAYEIENENNQKEVPH